MIETAEQNLHAFYGTTPMAKDRYDADGEGPHEPVDVIVEMNSVRTDFDEKMVILMTDSEV